jgi:hypothetical protein
MRSHHRATLRILIGIAIGFEVIVLAGLASPVRPAECRPAPPVMPESRPETRGLRALFDPSLPKFADYPAGEIFRGKPAAPSFASDPDAWSFRTRLREGAAKGPNFAGHYTIVSWTNGTDCQTTVIVDARNGAVFFTGLESSLGADFRLDSRLIVVNPPQAMLERGDHLDAEEFREMRERHGGPTYFEWVEPDMKLVLHTTNEPFDLR